MAANLPPTVVSDLKLVDKVTNDALKALVARRRPRRLPVLAEVIARTI